MISYISTHTPLTGRDVITGSGIMPTQQFLLTRPLRDVTLQNHKRHIIIQFLLTRPLRDVTSWEEYRGSGEKISTHTPLTGRDNKTNHIVCDCDIISTHTPLTGRDTTTTIRPVGPGIFLLTRPLRDVTAIGSLMTAFRNFYSHAPYGTWRSGAEMGNQ